MDDAGTIPRGVLEPTVEYALFTLKPGDVSDPIDTPRGFWIVRRIE
jgi:parvulin-like peptidyl-prolyl isomerase